MLVGHCPSTNVLRPFPFLEQPQKTKHLLESNKTSPSAAYPLESRCTYTSSKECSVGPLPPISNTPFPPTADDMIPEQLTTPNLN